MRIGTVALQAILNGQGIDQEAKQIAKSLIEGFKEVEAKTTFDKVLKQLEGMSKTAKDAKNAFGDINASQLDKLIDNLKRTQSEAAAAGKSIASILNEVQKVNAAAAGGAIDIARSLQPLKGSTDAMGALLGGGTYIDAAKLAEIHRFNQEQARQAAARMVAGTGAFGGANNANVMDLLGGSTKAKETWANLTRGSGALPGGNNANVMDLLGGTKRAKETWANLTNGSGTLTGGANANISDILTGGNAKRLEQEQEALRKQGLTPNRIAARKAVEEYLEDEHLKKTGQSGNRMIIRGQVEDYLKNKGREEYLDNLSNKRVESFKSIFTKERSFGAIPGLSMVTDTIAAPFKALSGALSVAGGILIDKALFKIADGLAYLGKSAVESAVMFERAKVSLGVLTGSKSEGNKMFESILKLGVSTPFTAQELLGQSKLLKSYGVSNYELTDTMSRIGDIASGTGSDINRVSLAYGQVMSKGRFQGPELRQFTEAGASVSDFVAAAKDLRYLGTQQWTTAKLLAEMENSRIGSDLVKHALIMMTSPGGRFYGMNSALQNTVSGQFSALKETGQIFVGKLGESFFKEFGIKDFLKSTRGLLEGMDMKGLSEWMGRASDGLRPFGEMIGLMGKEGASLLTRFYNMLPTWKEFGNSLTDMAKNQVPLVIDAVKLFGVSMIGLTKGLLTVADWGMKTLAPWIGTAPENPSARRWTRADEGNPNRMFKKVEETPANRIYKTLGAGIPGLDVTLKGLDAAEGAIMGLKSPNFNKITGERGVSNIGTFAGLGGLAGAASDLPASGYQWRDYRKDDMWKRYKYGVRMARGRGANNPIWPNAMEGRQEEINAQNRAGYAPEAQRKLGDVIKYTTEQFDRLANKALPDFGQRLKGLTDEKKYDHEEFQKNLTALNIGRLKGQLGLEGGLLPDQFRNGLLNSYEAATKGLNKTPLQAAPALESGTSAAYSAIVQAFYEAESRKPKTDAEILATLVQLRDQGVAKQDDDKTIIRTLETLSMQLMLNLGGGGKAR